MQYISVVAIAACSLLGTAAARGDREVVSLSSLEHGCIIERRWAGIHPRMDYAWWLHCGTGEFLITGPMSLYGHVAIRNRDAALEFVRLFTLASNDPYVRPDGLVEIFPESPERHDFSSVKASRFRRLFHDAAVTEIPAGLTEDAPAYAIKRIMLTPDGQVVEITESVSGHGFYDILSRRVVVRDASTVGLFYLQHWVR